MGNHGGKERSSPGVEGSPKGEEIFVAGVDQVTASNLVTFIAGGYSNVEGIFGLQSSPMGMSCEAVDLVRPSSTSGDKNHTISVHLRNVSGSLQIYPLWEHYVPARGLVYLWNVEAEQTESLKGNLMTEPETYLRYLIGETMKNGGHRTAIPVLIFVQVALQGKRGKTRSACESESWEIDEVRCPDLLGNFTEILGPSRKWKVFSFPEELKYRKAVVQAGMGWLCETIAM